MGGFVKTDVGGQKLFWNTTPFGIDSAAYLSKSPKSADGAL